MPKKLIEPGKLAKYEIECEWCHFVLSDDPMNSQPILVTFPYGHYLDSCVGIGGDYTYLCSDACAAEFFKDLASKPEQYQAKLLIDK